MKTAINLIITTVLLFSLTSLLAQSEYPYGEEDPINEYKNKETLHLDIMFGEGLFYNLVETDIQEIKKTHQMVRKVFLQNPSADPDELKDQVKGVLEDMKDIKGPKDLVEFTAKIGLDAFVDLFTSLGAREVNKARQVQYGVIIEAMTVECFPGYTPDIADYNFDEKILFYSLREKLSQLSNQNKYRLRARIIAGKTFSMDTFYTAERRFVNHMQDPSMFKRNLDNRFQKSKYRYRD
ncbi:MAG: hypothetical protein ACI9AT_000521 [Ulvibacter sp.]|jgi:hypothetical protein